MPDRIDDLERRLAAVEEQLAAGPRPVPEGSTKPDQPQEDDSGSLWALEGFKQRVGDSSGGVMFMGTWRPDPSGSVIEWQYGRPADHLVSLDWATAAPALAALGHPVRVHLLQRVLTGTTATKDLVETEGLGTSGQLHHHLRTLVSAGWLRQRARGDYEVPGPRIIPLMAILTATLD